MSLQIRKRLYQVKGVKSMNSMITSPCPYKYKYELVRWAHKRWPKQPMSKWLSMSIKQLKAIWYNS